MAAAATAEATATATEAAPQVNEYTSDRARLAFARLSQPAHSLLCVALVIAHTPAPRKTTIATAADQ